MSRFAKFATGLRDFGNDINANISKALNISKVGEASTQPRFRTQVPPHTLFLQSAEGVFAYRDAYLGDGSWLFDVRCSAYCLLLLLPCSVFFCFSVSSLMSHSSNTCRVEHT